MLMFEQPLEIEEYDIEEIAKGFQIQSFWNPLAVFETLWRGFKRVPGVPSVCLTYISVIQEVFYLTGTGGSETDLNKKQVIFLFLLGPRGFQVRRVPGTLCPRGFQAPSVELRGFHWTLEPCHIRPCVWVYGS